MCAPIEIPALDTNYKLPEAPEFKVLAVQNITIRNVTSGIHDYFPVSKIHTVSSS